MKTFTYRFCGAIVSSEIPLPPLRRVRSDDAACSFSLGRVDTTATTWFHEWRVQRRTWLTIGRRRRDYVLRFAGLADFAVSGDGARVTADPVGALPDDTFRHLLIDQVLPLALARRGRLLLHASAVHVPGFGTVGLVGRTGRGKSTLAAALAGRGARLVSDDCLGIDLGAASPRALPAYPGLRLWPQRALTSLVARATRVRVAHYSRKSRVAAEGLPFHASASLLRALFLLSPRARNGGDVRITRCRPRTALLGLIRCAYVLDIHDRRDLGGMFERLSEVVSRVPVARLRLRDGHGRLAHAADLVMQGAASLAAGRPRDRDF